MKRGGLFRKYAWPIVGIVGVVLAVQAAVQAWIGYRQTVDLVTRAERVEAELAADRLLRFFLRVENAVEELADLWHPGAPSDQGARRQDVHALLRREPAIAAVRYLDAGGRECLHVRRDRPDSTGCKSSLEAEDLPRPASGQHVYGAAYFDVESTPFIDVTHRTRAAAGGLIAALIHLGFIWEVVGEVNVGREGRVYVVDADNRLIAHPDIATVLRRLDVDELVAGVGRSPLAPLGSMSAQVETGLVVLTTAPVERAGWTVVVERPLREALRPLWAMLVPTLVAAVIGLGLALAASVALAQRLVRPILALQRSAQALGRGETVAAVSLKTDDELQSLAASFNTMAAQIQDYTQSLERKVADKTAELAAANQHKSEFLANVSHELRTPLNAVIGFSEALQAELFGALNAKQREYVEDIHGSGLHLLALINDLLDLSKVEAGRMELDSAPFDVPALVDAACSLVRPRAQQAGVRLAVEVAPGVGTWAGDERRVRQILLNLLSNAIKFTRAGGAVTVRAAQTAQMLTLAVQDTGIGIAPEDFALLFEPFRQVRDAQAQRQEGTGLGLALTRRLVELHGGTIEVQSEVGAGSTFTVRLPTRAESGE